MMRGALPLFVNIGVATFTSLRLQEIVGRNVIPVFGLHGTWEKLAVRTVAFLRHALRSDFWIFDVEAIFPGNISQPPGTCSNRRKHKQQRSEAKGALQLRNAQQTAVSEPRRCKKNHGHAAQP